MPDSPSNRERLLRLIDGGTEALKEMHTDTPAPKSPKPAAVPGGASPAVRLLAGVKAKMPAISEKTLTRLAQGLLVLGAVVAALHYGSEMLKTLKQPAKTVASTPAATSGPSAPALLSGEDESATGLRLVGVDSSDASPVALLEDLKTGKTYFARVNERVKGVHVKQIEKNKVTVSVRGKTVELR